MGEYLEDAWKEFERTGEICNAAEGLLSYVSDLRKENQQLAQDKVELVDGLSECFEWLEVQTSIEYREELNKFRKLLEKHK